MEGLMARKPARQQDPFAGRRTCRGCGCTDRMACPGGCSWVLLDISQPGGICSTCAEDMEFEPRFMAFVGMTDERTATMLRGALAVPPDVAEAMLRGGRL
jgi:hypothetical protein